MPQSQVGWRLALMALASAVAAVVVVLPLVAEPARPSAAPSRPEAAPPSPVAPLLDLQSGFEKLAERVGPSVVAISARRRLSASPPPAEGDHNQRFLDQLPDDEYERLFGRKKPKSPDKSGSDKPESGKPGTGKADPGKADKADPGEPPARDRVTSSAGSGVIITADGLILTNQHVIEDATEIEVALSDRRRFPARIVGVDPRSDLAVLKIEATGLPTAEFGDADRLRVGHWAVAMGNPFGLASDGRASLSVGVISAIGRHLGGRLGAEDDRYYGNLIQTDASINPGNSGGPLLNIYGQVIGINTIISTRSGGSEGVGFAVPINVGTRRIVEMLTAGKPVEYGYLGVRVGNPSPAASESAGLPMAIGALIAACEAGGPADRAGLQAGDIVTVFADQSVQDSDHLVRLVGACPIGLTVTLTARRQKADVRLTVQIGKRQVSPPEPAPKK